MTGRREGRSKHLSDDIKKTRGHWELKQETLDRALWKIHLGRRYGHVRQCEMNNVVSPICLLVGGWLQSRWRS
jgi:hypothetical protein